MVILLSVTRRRNKIFDTTVNICSRALVCVLVLFGSQSAMAEIGSEPTESDYYRIVTISTSQASSDSRSKNWKPAPDSLALEVSGMAFLEDSRLAVAIRKGEVWFLSNVVDDHQTK